MLYFTITMVKQNQTMAKMDKETLRRLKELRLTQRESYINKNLKK